MKPITALSLVAASVAVLATSGPVLAQEVECRNRIDRFMERYEANKDAFTEEEQEHIADLERLARNKCSDWRGERFLSQEAQMIMGRIAMAEQMKEMEGTQQ